MPQSLPAHTLMVSFLSNALSKRGITAKHLADLLSPIPEATIKSWLAGRSSPAINDLVPLAAALHVHPVEMIAGWMIDSSPSLERPVRSLTLDPMRSDFPRSTDLNLRAPKPRLDMNVGDPHDEHAPTLSGLGVTDRPVRKRASGARLPALRTVR